jgi:hypothetical protein
VERPERVILIYNRLKELYFSDDVFLNFNLQDIDNKIAEFKTSNADELDFFVLSGIDGVA